MVPIQDRGFLFGDGVFTTIKVDEGSVVQGNLHLERIVSHCQQLNIFPPKITLQDFQSLIKKNRAEKGIWRLKVIITGGNRTDLSLPQRDYGVYLVTIKPYIPNSTSLKVCRYPFPITSPLSGLKTLSYLERMRIKQYAIDRRFDDAITCSVDGFVLEAAFSNVYWKEGDLYYTPDSTLPLLQGTCIASLPEVQQAKITFEQLMEKKEIYLCNAMSVNKIAVLSI